MRFSSRKNTSKQWVAAVALTTVAAGLLGLPALAEGYVDASDVSQVVAGQEVDGSAYLAGSSVTMSGTVKGDLFCAGNTITITGTVEGDVLCAGNTVAVSGRVGGDMRLGGNSVTVSSGAGGAVTAMGNTVTMTDGSEVGTDLTAGAATLTLAGTVGRDARLGAGTATLTGRVARDVDARVDNLNVTDTANIGGHLFYESTKDAALPDGVVQGAVRRTDPPPQDTVNLPPQVRPSPTPGMWRLGAVIGVVGLVLLSMAVVLVLPRYVRRTVATSWGELGKAALVGLVAIAASLPIVVILLVTIIGAGAGLLLMVAYPLALVLAVPLTAYFLGRVFLHQRTASMFAMMAAGAAVLGVVGAIPFIGSIVTFAAACAGLGLIVLRLRDQFARPTYIDRATVTDAAGQDQFGSAAPSPYVPQDRPTPSPPPGPRQDPEVPRES